MKPNKLEKLLGKETISDMQGLDIDALRLLIVTAESAMKKVKEETESNPNYQELKLKLNDFSQAKREVDKRQKAKISYALQLLEEKGA